MNREQTRKLMKSITNKRQINEFKGFANLTNAMNNQLKLAEGTKVKLNYKAISSHPDYKTSNPEYIKYVEQHKDEELIVVFDEAQKDNSLVNVKSADGVVSWWTFWVGELTPVEEDILND